MPLRPHEFEAHAEDPSCPGQGFGRPDRDRGTLPSDRAVTVVRAAVCTDPAPDLGSCALEPGNVPGPCEIRSKPPGPKIPDLDDLTSVVYGPRDSCSVASHVFEWGHAQDAHRYPDMDPYSQPQVPPNHLR